MNKLLLLILVLLTMNNCFSNSEDGNMMDMDYRSIDLFINTPCFQLIKAIENEETSQIEKICAEDTSLVNYQEKKYNITPLIRACGRQKLKSVKKLLELGANPNLTSLIGVNPIFAALSGNWDEIDINTELIELLLAYGANPNCHFHIDDNSETDSFDVIEDSITPLTYAVSFNCKPDVIKLLVEHGSDINEKTRAGTTASIEALRAQNIQNAYYLIVEKDANISDPYYFYDLNNDIDYSDPRYPVDLLLNLIYEFDSNEYSLKKQIIRKFSEQGISYNQRKQFMPKQLLYRIKKLHPNDWEQFINDY